MEKVFWLMWLSDLVGSIGVVGVVSLIFFGLCMLVASFVAAAEERAEPFRRVWSIARWLLVPVAIACVIPNQKTVQILAVTSAAEAAANTRLGAKSIEAIDALLNKVIKEAKK